MILIKHLTVKNFMSIGNATQAVNFDRKNLTLVLGENLDLGGDGNRNGTGKTTLINALSYALYGTALTSIKKDNLVNRTNGRNMLVTIDFEKDGVNYRIERGRKYNVLKFYIGDVEQEVKDDNSQGDSRETQQEIERLLEASHDMFKHIVALNTYTEPFLALRAQDQRTIIEQLLGITLLSEKAESLKIQSKITRDTVQAEEFKIKAIQDANERIKGQIDSLIRRQKLWTTKHVDDTIKLQTTLDKLLTLDIDLEIAGHRALVVYHQKQKDIAELNKGMSRANADLEKEIKLIKQLEGEIAVLELHTCYACGQNFHDIKHEKVLDDKIKAKHEAELQQIATSTHLLEFTTVKNELGELGEIPVVFYELEEDAIHHRSSVANLQEQLLTKAGEDDPYTEQIDEMTHTVLAEIDYTTMNELVRIREHQEFLLKLLTNKDSYIRKRIIDQNLSYLNSRLSYYLHQIGLPHTVKFLNDLTVDIQELGRDLDFHNLSRGEMTRVIFSLSLAFRDVWETLFQKINLLCIDELLDNGLDASGVENALAILKKMSRDTNKSIWLVSHKDELSARVSQIMKVVKSNGYTEYHSPEEDYI